jgi:hypothetical protein
MHQFKISSAGIAGVKRKTMRTTVPLMVVAVLVGGFLPELAGRGRNMNANTILILVPFMAGVLGFGFWKGFKRQRQLLESYTLTVETHDLVREQFDTPTVRIPKKDVAGITQHANGSFTIKGSNGTGEIIVLPQVENHAELARLLGEISPVTVLTSTPVLQKYSTLLGLVMVGLFALHFIAASPVAVAGSGVALIGLLLWSFFTIVRNKNVDNKTARGSYWVLFVILAVIIRIIYKVF